LAAQFIGNRAHGIIQPRLGLLEVFIEEAFLPLGKSFTTLRKKLQYQATSARLKLKALGIRFKDLPKLWVYPLGTCGHSHELS